VRLLRAVTGKISFSDRGFIMSSKASLACAGAFAAAATFAGIAFAAEPAPTPPPPIPIFIWTGLYVGGQIGYAWGQDPLLWSGTSNDDETAAGTFGNSPQGVIGGAHVGYWLVFGVGRRHARYPHVDY
jgi:outer membrane immunogenic protein